MDPRILLKLARKLDGVLPHSWYAESWIERHAQRFATVRNLRVAAGSRHGRTVSIGWPLWKNGGMRLDAAAEADLRASGMEPLSDDGGWRVLLAALSSDEDHLIAVAGDPQRVRVTLREKAPAFQQIVPRSSPAAHSLVACRSP